MSQCSVAMALPKEVTYVTFDVYGTLIDWETGVYEAFAKEAEKDGYTLSREELVPLFLETQQEIKGGSYELYAEVLRRAGYDEQFIAEVARVMEYSAAYDVYREDVETAAGAAV